MFGYDKLASNLYINDNSYNNNNNNLYQESKVYDEELQINSNSSLQ